MAGLVPVLPLHVDEVPREVVEPRCQCPGDLEQHVGVLAQERGTVGGLEHRDVGHRPDGGRGGTLEHGRHLADQRSGGVEHGQHRVVAFDAYGALHQNVDRPAGLALFDDRRAGVRAPLGEFGALGEQIGHASIVARPARVVAGRAAP